MRTRLMADGRGPRARMDFTKESRNRGAGAIYTQLSDFCQIVKVAAHQGRSPKNQGHTKGFPPTARIHNHHPSSTHSVSPCLCGESLSAPCRTQESDCP